ncbi:MAG: MBL fold metallo-hydrolase, partial [Rhodanobacteraceae bacterium]
ARTHPPLAACRSGQAWHWDGVAFRVLHPDDAWPQGSNDGSCVVLISAVHGRVLLTGDISRLVEPVIARRVGVGPPLVLLVPHHGSKTSSSAAFLAQLDPRMAVVSAGWHNRFGHPAAPVVARFARAGIPFYNTARSGAVIVDFPNDAAPRLRERLRCDRRHYWHHHACAGEPKRAANTAIMRPLTNLPE